MATVSSWSALGVGSGLDLENLVKGLMSIEQRPLDALKSQVSSYNTKISAMGTLTSKLSALQTAAKALKPDVLQSPLDKFGTFTASTSDDKIAGIEVGTGARSGGYRVDVETLAQAQKTIVDGGQVNGGAISFSFGDSSKDFTVTPGGTSLTSVANAINAAGKGVNATIVNSDGGQKLVLTGAEGTENAFSVSGAGITGAVAPPVTTAQDATLKIDGLTVTSASNTVKGAIEGVTLNLKQTGTTDVTVKADYGEKTKAQLEGLVKAFNETISSIKSLGSYDSETGTAGALNGNRVLRETQSALRDLVFGQSAVTDGNGDAMTLSKLGITFAKDGTISLDADKLAKAVVDNSNVVANFAADIGTRFNAGVDKLVGPGGLMSAATDGIKTSITSLEKRQTSLEARLESVEARYRKQFSALDTLMAKMNSTSSYLAQQLASIAATK